MRPTMLLSCCYVPGCFLHDPWLVLAQLQHDLLSFGMWDNNRFAPPCWDTPPVALNFSRTFHGEDKRQRLGSVVENLKREIRSLSTPSLPRPRIQTLAYKAFVSHFVPDDMDALLIRRLAVISNFPFSSFDRLDLQSITACLQCTDKFLAMCWLKTMCNGWCTTTRMHEANKLNCVLG